MTELGCSSSKSKPGTIKRKKRQSRAARQQYSL